MNIKQSDTTAAHLPRIEEISHVRRSWTPPQTEAHIRTLPIWNGPIEVEQKFGGLQNRTFFVTTSSGEKFAVRIGFDQFRTRQTAIVQCTIAAHTLGVGPRLIYAEPNLTVTEFVDGTTPGLICERRLCVADTNARLLGRIEFSEWTESRRGLSDKRAVNVHAHCAGGVI